MIRIADCGSSDFSASCLSAQCALSTTRCLAVHGQSRKGHLVVVWNCKASMMTLQSLVSMPLEHASALGIARRSIDADADKDAVAWDQQDY